MFVFRQRLAAIQESLSSNLSMAFLGMTFDICFLWTYSKKKNAIFVKINIQHRLFLMKRTLFTIFSALLILSSCAPELDLTEIVPGTGVEESSDDTGSTIIFSAEAGSATLTINASRVWTIDKTGSEDDSWLSCSPYAGGKGESTVTISVKENDTYSERSATLILKCDNLSKEIKVIQHDTDFLATASDSYNLDYDQTRFELTVQANRDYHVSSTGDWLRPVETKTLRTDKIIFDVDRNDGKTSRKCSVIITDGTVTRTISITQLAISHYPRTDEEKIASMVLTSSIFDESKKILENYYHSTQDIDEVIKRVSEITGVYSAKLALSGNAVNIMQKDSVTVFVLLPEFYNDSTPLLTKSTDIDGIYNPICDYDASFPTSKKALYLIPFYDDRKSISPVIVDVSIDYDISILEYIGYQVDTLRNQRANLAAFSGEKLQDYSVIIFDCHGLCDTIDKSVGPETFLVTGGFVLGNLESFPDRNSGKVQTSDWKGRAVWAISKEWIKKDNPHFDNSIVYSGSCMGFKTDDLANYFINNGANAYIGYRESVDFDQEFILKSTLIDRMAHGSSLEESISYTKKYLSQDGNSFPIYNDFYAHTILEYKQIEEKSVFFANPCPTNLKSTLSGNKVSLSWDISTWTGSYEYDVYINGERHSLNKCFVRGEHPEPLIYICPKSNQYSWFVVASLLDDDGKTVIASYKSAVEEFTYTAPYIDAKLLNEDISCEAGTVTVEVDSNVDVSVNVPDNDWLTYKGVSSDGKKHTFSMAYNPDLYSRSVNVEFYNRELGLSKRVRITQNPAIYPDDWSTREFWHRSFVLLYARQGCSPAPPEMEGVNTFKSRYSDKVEVLSVYHNDGFPLPRVFNSPSLVDKYDFSYTPCSLFNGKDYVWFNSTSADTQREMIRKVDANKARTGIGFTSRIEGDNINVDVSLLVKSKGKYSISVFLMEDNVIAFQAGARDENNYRHDHVARKALTADTGDKFSTTQDNVVKDFSYSTTIPSSVNKNNLKVLVVTHIETGSYSISYSGSLNETFYGSYVDNAASEKAGVRHKVDFVDNRDGSNENINPGGDIDFN